MGASLTMIDRHYDLRPPCSMLRPRLRLECASRPSHWVGACEREEVFVDDLDAAEAMRLADVSKPLVRLWDAVDAFRRVLGVLPTPPEDDIDPGESSPLWCRDPPAG